MQMIETLNSRKQLFGAVLLAGTLAACGSSGGLSGINTLGQAFVAAFNAGANAQPVDPDNVALTLTPGVEPFNP